MLFKKLMGKNLIRTAPDFILFSRCCSLSRIAVFSKPVVVKKVIEPKPLIGWGQVNTHWKVEDVLYLFWYLTISHISDWTVPDFNLLTVAHSQDWNDVVIRFFLFRGDVDGLSVVIHYRAFKSYAHTRNLASYHRILLVMVPGCDYVSEQSFEPNCLYGRLLFSSNVESFLLKNLGDLLFDQVILMLFLVSRILAQSTKIWWHGIVIFLHCTMPYASSHKHKLTGVFITLSKSVGICCNLECILYNFVVIECFWWPLLDCYLLELYLAPHPLDSPCASHVSLTIK
jgi:hypothetical protein